MDGGDCLDQVQTKRCSLNWEGALSFAAFGEVRLGKNSPNMQVAPGHDEPRSHGCKLVDIQPAAGMSTLSREWQQGALRREGNVEGRLSSVSLCSNVAGREQLLKTRRILRANSCSGFIVSRT